ncbi:MAG: hypothetical protein II851_03035 [Bacteroidales bacterium]|nr:hypothetical protein [Bacteroidales bacterium]
MNTMVLLSLLVTLMTAVPDGNPAISAPDGGSQLIQQFQEPSQAARPYVWWHWMDGEVSLDGIRKDLEWMDAVGIAGFHQFDAGGVNMPKAAPFKRPYLSEDWKEAFRFAVNLADSLGMEMAVASAPGWSSTGGPWVSPEDAMKKIEWQTVEVNGGQVDIQLPEQTKVTGPYQDIPLRHESLPVPSYGYDVAVIAVKLPDAEKSMEDLGASVQKDGDTTITVSFPRKTTIRAFTLQSLPTGIRPRLGDTDGPNEIQYSLNGKDWKPLVRIPKSPQDFTTMNIPATKARSFRAVGPHIQDLRLHTVGKLEHIEEKAGFANCYDFNRYPTVSLNGEKCASSREVQDLSGALAEDGTLRCTLPAGRWRIYRFGASLTGKMNHPASPNATGLEVDKLDKEAWTRYFHKYLEMYKEAASGLLGERGITHMLVDSYEAGPATWSRHLPEEFLARRGYALQPWLPVLAGEIIGSAERSEQFLVDWRKTLGELFAENYQRLNELIGEYGMKGTYIESHETGRAFMGDGMDIKKRATVPMSAIWMTESPSGSMLAAAISDIRESASVAHIYGQNLTAAESFTVNGDNKRAYTYHPGNIKRIADIALASGLNRFVIHDSASQPSDDYLPGLALFRYGQWFHRNETWALYARVWTDYLARSCQMMQTGRSVADILLFYGEDTNATGQYGGEYLSYLPRIPVGFNFDYANPDVLLHAVKPESGCLVTESGQRYRVLVLGGLCRKYMSDEIRARIETLKAAGVLVCFEDELPATIANAGLAPDVVLDGSAVGLWNDGFLFGGKVPQNSRGHDCTIAGIQFVHRTCSGTDLYWLGNFTQKEWRGKVHFREGGHCAALFNAEDGSMYRIPRDGDAVELTLKAGDAVFVVLTDQPLDLPEAKPEYSAREIMPLERWWDVEFHQKGGESAMETFSELNDWTTNIGDPVVRYFSGTAHYSSVFTVPAGALTGLKEARIDLGVVYVMAELIVNGHNAGVLWRTPFLSPDLLPWLHEGENTIEVNVTNLWVNRMIGDRQKGEAPVTRVRRFYNAGDKLLPSGLLGPVRLMGYN